MIKALTTTDSKREKRKVKNYKLVAKLLIGSRLKLAPNCPKLTLTAALKNMFRPWTFPNYTKELTSITTQCSISREIIALILDFAKAELLL